MLERTWYAFLGSRATMPRRSHPGALSYDALFVVAEMAIASSWTASLNAAEYSALVLAAVRGNAGELQAVMTSLKSTGVLRQSVGNRTLHNKLHEGQRGRFWRELPARQDEINQRCVELVTNTSILRAVLPRFERPGEADNKLDKRQQRPPAEVLSRHDAKALASPLAETYRRCAYTRLPDPGHAGANARCSATLALALEPALHRFWSACLLTEVDRLRENHSQVDVLTSARGNLEPWPLSLIAGHLGLSV